MVKWHLSIRYSEVHLNWIFSKNRSVDKISTAFSLSTSHIDKFFTQPEAVDNFYEQGWHVVDKGLKSIADKSIICYHNCVLTLNKSLCISSLSTDCG
jgi:hypothetical protein